MFLLRQRCDVLETSVAPYQEENGRLLTQINRLHMANLRLREQVEKHDKGNTHAHTHTHARARVLLFISFMNNTIKRVISLVSHYSSSFIFPF